jgi:hypothetical protein
MFGPATMTTHTPYRASAESPERPTPPALFVAWDDAEEKTNPIKVFYAILFSLLGAALLWAASPTVAVVFAVVVTVGFLVVFRARPPKGVGLEVHGETLVISRPDEAKPTTVALASVRNVEIERKAIQRVTYQQRISDALPTTDLSDDVEVARIVLSLDGDVPPEALTETWAPVFVCMERFGKVRTFLRAHGWLPLPEREPR